MRFVTTLFLIASMMVFSGCTLSESPNANLAHESAVPAPATMARAKSESELTSGSVNFASSPTEKISTESLSADQAQTQAAERKVIQNAELTIELDAPEKTQRGIALIAEKHGGFIVTSETKQNPGNAQAAPQTTMTVIARVPAAKFNQVVEEIQGLGGNVIHRKLAGQDVTEEFIDLEARIRTKRALESQIMEIMKRAGKISDALEVQKELANVRSEIEQMEGRRRFLENQAALSTITVTLRTPMPIVAATTGGFWHSVKLAFGDSLDTAAGIVLGLIRFVLVMIPVTLLILLPGWFIVRWVWRRIEWMKPSTPISSADQSQ